MAHFSFHWRPDEGRFSNGVHVKVGRLGKLRVWWDGNFSRDKPEPPYKAAAFGHVCENRFVTQADGQAWCEKWCVRMLREALADIGLRDLAIDLGGGADRVAAP